MKIVAISDTHRAHREFDIPEADLLICSGDITSQGEVFTFKDFNEWGKTLPVKNKIFVPGNHDFLCESNPEMVRGILKDWIYLSDESVTINGIKIYGSPWQPWFHDWAFNLQRGEEIKKKWDLIPADTDILVTHGPPKDVLDFVRRGGTVGCEELAKAVERIAPKYHIFGHIHEGYGQLTIGKTTFINASCMNEWYSPVNIPIVFEF